MRRFSSWATQHLNYPIEPLKNDNFFCVCNTDLKLQVLHEITVGSAMVHQVHFHREWINIALFNTLCKPQVLWQLHNDLKLSENRNHKMKIQMVPYVICAGTTKQTVATSFKDLLSIIWGCLVEKSLHATKCLFLLLGSGPNKEKNRCIDIVEIKSVYSSWNRHNNNNNILENNSVALQWDWAHSRAVRWHWGLLCLKHFNILPLGCWL